MKQVAIFVGLFCLIAACNGAFTTVGELERIANECCSHACTQERLTYLRDLLLIYKGTLNPDLEMAKYAESVLGGMCKTNSKRSSSAAESMLAASHSRRAVSNAYNRMNIYCPTIAPSGSVINCTVDVAADAGLFVASVYGSSGVSCQDNCYVYPGGYQSFTYTVPFYVYPDASGNVTIGGYFSDYNYTTYFAPNVSVTVIGGITPTPAPNNTNYNSMVIGCPPSTVIGQVVNCSVFIYSESGISFTSVYLPSGSLCYENCQTNGSSNFVVLFSLTSYSDQYVYINGYFIDGSGRYFYGQTSIYVFGGNPTPAPNNTGSMSITCPAYAYSGTYVNCSVQISSPSGVYTSYVTSSAWWVSCTENCYNYYSDNYAASFYVYSGYSGNVSISGYYQAGNGITYYAPNTTIYVLGSNPTDAPTSPPQNNTNNMYISCPNEVSGNQFTCDVYIYSTTGVSYAEVYSNNYYLNCYNCYGYNTSFTVSFYIDSANLTGYVTINGYFRDYYYNYYYAQSVYVYIRQESAQFSLVSFTGPTSPVSSSNVTFNVSAVVQSTNPIYYGYIYYTGSTGATFGGYIYRSYSSGNLTYLFGTTQSYYSVPAGVYCPIISVQDVYGNYAQFNSTVCVTIAQPKCDGGYYFSSSKNVCEPCPRGFYNPEPNSNGYCLACSGGYTSACVLGSRSCVPCAAGTTSVNGVCTPCAVGTYTSYYGQASCSPCPAGYYAGSTGSTTCYGCAPGSYACAGASQCKACAAGTYATGYAEACVACASGYVAPTNSSMCSICPAGTYATKGAATCTNCPAGKTSPEGSFTCFTAKK